VKYSTGENFILRKSERSHHLKKALPTLISEAIHLSLSLDENSSHIFLEIQFDKIFICMPDATLETDKKNA